jgi:integrase/recombinase XerC
MESPTKAKRTNFQMVAVGACPHDNAELLPQIRTKGEGAKTTCSKCGHTWYINKKIRTCKCLTCSATKEKPQRMELTERGVTKILSNKNGGPLWSRTTDLSLIRSEVYENLSTYIDLWYREQKLKGIGDITLYGYRRKVEALLGECTNPNEFDIKQYLVKKQEFGAMSGTIANYVKAFRSFFGYLCDKGLYNLDPRCLPLPEVRNREKRVPSDEDVTKLLSVVTESEGKIALLLLVDCGIRIHELATIEVKNINFNDTSILINGKGGKLRTVYLSETTVEHLRAYIQTLKGEYLFPSTRADARSFYRNRTYFEKRLRELCERAGIERITPHQLRHYFATYTLSRGGDIKAVSEILGHADVGITLKIYHHVNAKAIKEMHSDYSPLR